MRCATLVRATPLLLLCALCPQALMCSRAQAAGECGRAGKPWVSIAFEGDAWDAPLQATVLADLRAELALQGFDACVLGSRGSQPPLALIEIKAAQADQIQVVIGIHDAITEKQLVRDVNLAEVSPDGHGLAVAVAADELLRASWAELTLDDAPEPAMAPPPEVDRTLRASLSPRYANGGQGGQGVGARFVVRHHTGGQTWLGGDALLTAWFGDVVGGELSVGAREGVAVDADNGTVESRAFVGAVAARVALLPRGRALGLSAGLGLAAASVQLSGRASEGAVARDGAAFGLDLDAGLSMNIRLLSPLALRLDAGIGVPLREVEATAEARVVSSTGGLSVQAGAGLELAL